MIVNHQTQIYTSAYVRTVSVQGNQLQKIMDEYNVKLVGINIKTHSRIALRCYWSLFGCGIDPEIG